MNKNRVCFTQLKPFFAFFLIIFDFFAKIPAYFSKHAGIFLFFTVFFWIFYLTQLKLPSSFFSNFVPYASQ